MRVFSASWRVSAIWMLLAGLLAAGATAARGAETTPVSLAEGDRVVFVGDSITGQGQNAGHGFIRRMGQALGQGEAGAPVLIPLGGSGQGVGSWMGVEKRSREQEAFLDVKGVDVKSALDGGADVLIVMLGTNDVLAPYVGANDTAVQQWAARYRELVQTLRARSGAKVVAVASIAPVTEDPQSPRNRLIERMNQQVKALAGDQGYRYLPVNETIFEVLSRGRAVDPAFHVTADYVHPNEAGHLGIAIGMLRGLGHPGAADRLAERVTELVERASASAKPVAEIPAWLVGTGLVQPWKGAEFDAAASRTPVDEAIESGGDFTAAIDLGDGNTLNWRQHVPSVDYVGGAAPGSIDFTAVAIGRTFESGYAARWIHSPRPRPAELVLSTRTFAGDQHVTAWLNGSKVYGNLITKAPGKRATVAVELREGPNVLVLKSNHRTWQWQVSADLVGVGEDDLADLRYEASPPNDMRAGAAQVGATTNDAAKAFAGPVLKYRLETPSQVTLVIEDAAGRRVRNLLAAAPREAGEHEETWDGLDDVGQPVPAGEYRWRGLTRGEITTHFQGAFNSPGNPPWVTMRPVQWHLRTGTNGAWLSDHAPPLCSYADGERIFLGAAIAEAGHSIIQVDPQGNKQLGILWLSLGCANAMTVEGDVLYAASERAWMRDSLAVNRFDFNRRAHVPNPPALKEKRTDNAFIKEKLTDFSGIRGIVLTPEAIVLSLADKDRLAFFDRETAVHLRDLPLAGAGTIIRAPSGEYLGISGTQVVRLDLENGRHEPLISENLEEPGGLAVASDGTVYVTDLAPAEQCIKVFSADGKMQGRIGKPGGRKEGPFDPQAMSRPTSVSLDGQDQLWVTEHDLLPRRVSVWGRDGRLIRDMVGGADYGGGGALDPEDPSRAYYRGMAFRWEKWPGGFELTDVLFRIEEHSDLPLKLSDKLVGHFPIRRGGRTYLVQDFNWSSPGVFIGEMVDQRLKPRAILGSLEAMRAAWGERQAEFVSQLPTSPNGVFLWVDRNDDGRAEPSEVSIRADWSYKTMWSLRVAPDMTLYAQTPEAIVAISPRAGDGPLDYDVEQAVMIPKPPIVQQNGIGALATDLEGNLIINCGAQRQQGDRSNVLMGLSRKGEVLWTYPNPYPANWHDSPRPRLGDIQHTLNVEGVAPADHGVGGLFQLNGNKGVRYLFTTDGLFVDQIFQDGRLAPWQQTLEEAVYDMEMQQISLVDECFFGWFGRAADGRYLQVVGKDSCNVLELRGLETLRRLPGETIRLDAAAAPAATGTASQPEPVEVTVGGISDNWMKAGSRALPADDPVARFALGGTSGSLELRVEVTDDSPFINNGDDASSLFKTGDAIDLRLATDPAQPADRMTPAQGDVRIVLTMQGDRPIAVRYRFVVPGTQEPVAFGRYSIDEVRVLEKVSINVTRAEKGYTVRVRIPWADLGLAGRPNETLRGDLGVIFSDPTGTRAVARHYYFDQGSQAVSDLPTEASVYPARWGELRF